MTLKSFTPAMLAKNGIPLHGSFVGFGYDSLKNERTIIKVTTKPDGGGRASAAGNCDTASCDQRIDFKPNGALDFIDDRGFRGSSQMFESTDGVEIELTKVWRGSSEDADEALEERLREAGRVVERTPLLDKKGLRFGDRALAYFLGSGEGGETPAVLRTDGDAFYSPESSSLRHLLLLEKELFESKPRPKEKAAPTGLRPDN